MSQLATAREPAPLPVGLNEGLLETEQKLAEISRLRSQLEERQALLSSCDASIRSLEAAFGSSWTGQATDTLSWDESDDRTGSDVDRRYRQLLGLSGRQPSSLWLRLTAFFFSRKLKKYYINNIECLARAYLRDAGDVLSFFAKERFFSRFM